MPEKLYTRQEIAELGSISLRKVAYLIESGELETVKVGRLTRIPERAWHDYVERNTGGRRPPLALGAAIAGAILCMCHAVASFGGFALIA